MFTGYWKFLQSSAEAELAAARKKLSSLSSELEKTLQAWPTFSDSEISIKILKKDIPEELEQIKEVFSSLKEELTGWVENIKKEQLIEYIDKSINFEFIDNLILQKQSIEKKLIDPTPVIRKIQAYISYLEQKKQTSTLKEKIREYIDFLRWKNAISKISFSVVKGSITRKKTEIMEELVVSEYVKIFNDETNRLDCNFGLKIDTHGRDANTVKGLKLEFAQGFNPSDILSEGEQTVSALADFLAEARINKNNAGVIFDDPVTSLDHGKRSIIAQRLAQEAKERQVIVLTHDIVFLLDLQSYAEREKVNCLSTSMRKNGEKVGVIKPELPWIAQNVRDRVGYLKNELQTLSKNESGDQDIYRNQVKNWYELLREAWERVVEERLFKGVVQRFDSRVQTQKLGKVTITPELINEITDNMSDSSKWLHDLAAGVNPAIPKNDKMKEHIEILDNFIKKCKAD